MQKELAEKVAVQASAVNQWVKGKRQPTYDVLMRRFIILDTEPSKLLGFRKIQTNMENKKERRVAFFFVRSIFLAVAVASRAAFYKARVRAFFTDVLREKIGFVDL